MMSGGTSGGSEGRMRGGCCLQKQHGCLLTLLARHLRDTPQKTCERDGTIQANPLMSERVCLAHENAKVVYHQ